MHFNLVAIVSTQIEVKIKSNVSKVKHNFLICARFNDLITRLHPTVHLNLLQPRSSQSAGPP